MRQVGELYYKKQEGISDDPDIQELFEKIRNSEAEIAEAEKQIDTLKGICRCKNCGAEMRITDNFCMMCETNGKTILRCSNRRQWILRQLSQIFLKKTQQRKKRQQRKSRQRKNSRRSRTARRKRRDKRADGGCRSKGRWRGQSGI